MFWVIVLLAVVAGLAAGFLVIVARNRGKVINERMRRYTAPRDRVLTRLNRYAG